MLGTKEFLDVLDMFERTYAKQYVQIGSAGLQREPQENWQRKFYYADGNLNKAFHAYLSGYSLGKFTEAQNH